MTAFQFVIVTVLLRIGGPLLMCLNIIVGLLAWRLERYGLTAINALLLGVNSMVTLISWTIFEL